MLELRRHFVPLVCWLAAVGVGLGAMVRYQATPAAVNPVTRSWPNDSEIPRSKERNEKVVHLFAHPHCPCTRAALRMLDRVLQHGGSEDRLAHAQVVLVRPAGCPEGWERGRIRRLAQQLALQLQTVDEPEARLYGASTSGEVYAYDEEGKLRFHGSITRGRGHEGPNPGANALRAFLNDEKRILECVETPLYGCPLWNGNSAG